MKRGNPGSIPSCTRDMSEHAPQRCASYTTFLTPPRCGTGRKRNLSPLESTVNSRPLPTPTPVPAQIGNRRERERETETETEKEKQTERDRDRDRERETETDRQTETETLREADRDRDTDRETDRETDRQTGRQRQGDTERDRERKRETERERQRETETDRETDRERQRQADRHRETVRETERQRQTGRQRQGDTARDNVSSLGATDGPAATLREEGSAMTLKVLGGRKGHKDNISEGLHGERSAVPGRGYYKPATEANAGLPDCQKLKLEGLGNCLQQETPAHDHLSTVSPQSMPTGKTREGSGEGMEEITAMLESLPAGPGSHTYICGHVP
ncbi:hypothetical protein Bbelb_141550 [Branchiostoma belcheri]|nr:hypothetical protein Bbelb_141550 [Branchiostoma belcheri]